jgi:hypothetical protein
MSLLSVMTVGFVALLMAFINSVLLLIVLFGASD